MNWSAVLNVALGLALVYLLFSVAASRINEIVATRLQWRAKGLERALYTLLGGPTQPPEPTAGKAADGTPVTKAAAQYAVQAPDTHQLSAVAVKGHPIIAAFDSAAGKDRGISYLASRAFSAVVLDLLAPPAVVLVDSIDATNWSDASKQSLEELRAHPTAANLEALEDTHPPVDADMLSSLRHAIAEDVLEQASTSVRNLPADNPARRPLLRMLADAGADRDAFRSKVEHWYDDEMARLSGWYKRKVQRWIIGYGLALTLAFNVDTINIAQTLWRSPVQQAATAAAAARATHKDLSKLDTSISALRALALPLGWTTPHVERKGRAGKSRSTVSPDPRHFPASVGQGFLKALGLLITTFALGFGAPFWFDALGKLARVRNSGPAPARAAD
jgi:hypothetical protein